MPTKEVRARKLGCRVGELPDNRGKHNNHARGSNHPKWNNILLSTEGYKKIRVGLSHPLADGNGYAYEHILIVASVYGINHLKSKIVHHKNGDKLDNRIENLEIMTKEEHNHYHNEHDKDRDVNGRIVGKKQAGRLLDGIEYSEYPNV